MSEQKFSWNRLGGVAVLVLVLYFVLQKTGLLNFSPSVESGSGLAAVFVIGLIASVSSCTALVGGLVVAVSAAASKRAEGNASFATRVRPHVLFNLGRFIGFAGLGALTGLIGRAFTLSPQLNGFLIVLVALLMISLGLNLLGLWPPALVPRPPAWLARRILKLETSPNPFVPFVLGSLTYFLPCGFTQSMQLLALSTGDPARAAAIMAVFALGTMPALLGIGAVVSASRGGSLRRLTQAAGVLVIVLGIVNIQNGSTLLGIDVSFAPPASSGTSTVAGNEQTIQMAVTNYGYYSPNVLRVKAGILVRWEIEGGTSMGCASSLILPAFGVRQALRPGINEITFTPTAPGSYVFSCSMGMVRGTMIVE